MQSKHTPSQTEQQLTEFLADSLRCASWPVAKYQELLALLQRATQGELAATLVAHFANQIAARQSTMQVERTALEALADLHKTGRELP